MSVFFTTFATALGACAIAWGPAGVVRVWLPDEDEAALKERVVAGTAATEGAPTEAVAAGMAAMVQLLATGRADLDGIALDMEGIGAFHKSVYEVTRAIPPGQTLTYGEVAARVGSPHASRAVGQALGQNPWPIVVPCHRVLAAGGKIGGFSAPGGRDTKRAMLAIEGAIGQVEMF